MGVLVRAVASVGVVNPAALDRGLRHRPRPEPGHTALVVGATSDIGRAIARSLGRDGWSLQLAGRDTEQLKADARDLMVRGATVSLYECDVLDDDVGVSLLDVLDPLPNVAVCAVGLLGDQADAERNRDAAELIMRTNYVGPALLMGALAERFERRGSGVLVGISSVAGERGRGTNYVYGSAKCGFTAFLSGLRNRLHGSCVCVVTLKPGFVRTRMTDHLDLPAWLTVEPAQVADAVRLAIAKRRDVVYVGRVWRVAAFVLRTLPEFVFKRTSL